MSLLLVFVVILSIITTTAVAAAATNLFDITGLNVTLTCGGASGNNNTTTNSTGDNGHDNDDDAFSTITTPGCLLRIPGNDVDRLVLESSSLSACLPLNNVTVAWAPTTTSLDDSQQILQSLNCSNSCSVQCSSDCTCTSSTTILNGTELVEEDCPLLLETAPPPLIDEEPNPSEFPIVNDKDCPFSERIQGRLEHSIVQCPYLMQNESLPLCNCTYVFCRTKFLGCGPLSLAPCLGPLTRCVLSDRLCPLPPTPAPVIMPTKSPSSDPSIPPTCASVNVTNNTACAQACFAAGIPTTSIRYASTTITINGETVVGQLCECTGIVFCFTKNQVSTTVPTQAPVSTTSGTVFRAGGLPPPRLPQQLLQQLLRLLRTATEDRTATPGALASRMLDGILCCTIITATTTSGIVVSALLLFLLGGC
ncbi:hypothetical protein ACA910_005208 [Epithemia clementina (nom. ined.)]